MLKFLMLVIMPHLVLANTWQDLWLNKNQQGTNLLKQNKNSEAAKIFTDQKWKAIAYYRDAKYQEAYELFKQDNSAQGLYNQGNSLAHLQKYKEAINAYDKSLKLEKNAPDTIYNKKLVEKLLKQQEEQNKQEKQQSDDKKSDEDKSQQNSDKQQNNSSDKSNNTQDSKQSADSKQNEDQSTQQQNTQDKKTDEPSNQDKTKQEEEQAKQQDKLNKEAEATKKTPNQEEGTDEEDATAIQSMRQQTPVDKEVKATLSQIPDDPGGLLKNKFLRDYQNQQQDGNNE